MFGSLEESLNNLLETIERNGEFEKYVEMLADRQEREQRELRRRAREMRRLEQGDAYISSGSEDSPNQSDEEVSETGDSYGGEVDVSNLDRLTIQNSEVNQTLSSPFKIKTETGEMGEGLKSEFEEDKVSVAIMAEQMNVVSEAFNPLRYIAMQLKELNQQKKAR